MSFWNIPLFIQTYLSTLMLLPIPAPVPKTSRQNIFQGRGESRGLEKFSHLGFYTSH